MTTKNMPIALLQDIFQESYEKVISTGYYCINYTINLAIFQKQYRQLNNKHLKYSSR